ncbi:MAG: 3-phosphoglycerate dehydrogenase [Clostridia bacterium]|nr:3-phosphoglycerate dehydrogenase [Clostridia bacterium]
MDILTLNAISTKANQILEGYNLVKESENPQGILVRSFNMNEWDLPSSTLAVARAGAGVNNIPHGEYAKKGVCVFNTPGANANAVKELAIASLILASRNLHPAMTWAKTLTGDDVAKQVEKGKGQFVGNEIMGKTLCVIGLGAIGKKVAISAHALGMNVVAYTVPLLTEPDPTIPFVTVYNTIEEAVENADYITLHIPYLPATKNTINSDLISHMKKGVIIVNTARGEIADLEAVKEGIESGIIRSYVLDFPTEETLAVEGIINTPHLGASTEESEENCAVMASQSLKEYIEKGNVGNSVNMPNLSIEPTKAHRYTVISTEAVEVDGVSALRNGIRYTIIDTDNLLDEASLEKEGVIKVRKVF